MIVARYRNGEVTVFDDGTVDVRAQTDREQARVAKLFTKPADVQVSESRSDGAIVELLVQRKPGEPGHARAVLSQLRDLRIAVDSG